MFYTGYSDTYDDRPAYYGTNMTGPESAEELRFPGLSPDAARWLITNRCIASVGIDTMSIDYGQSKTYEYNNAFTISFQIFLHGIFSGHIEY